MSNTFRAVFSFPNPVNEVAARMVAAMVLVLSVAIILTGQPWLLFLLLYGFIARVLTGPNLSPMGMLATRVLVPIFGNRQRLVPGPPKRFAQSVGLVFSAAALMLYFLVDTTIAVKSVVGLLAVAGYSVNDTIVIFDRIRENVARNIDRPLAESVNISILESVGRSLGTSLTTTFALLAMILIGGSTLREFLLVLLIGTAAGTYSSIFIASQFLVMWEMGEVGRFFRFLRLRPARA